MVDIMELPKARVNASMLSQYIERPVCFVGKLEKLDEEISGIVEVVGKVTAKATILCASYILFKEDCNRFDLELYNEAVKIINEFPQFFPLGLTQHE
nr:replication protein A 14 kDa subunit isoform X1 [Rattus norvegicus]